MVQKQLTRRALLLLRALFAPYSSFMSRLALHPNRIPRCENGTPVGFDAIRSERPRANCAYCQIETHLHFGGRPICVPCLGRPRAERKSRMTEQQVHSVLLYDVAEMTARNSAASEAFNDLIRRHRDETLPPCSAQDVFAASLDASYARKGMMAAQERLEDFLSSGIPPKDLKRST